MTSDSKTTRDAFPGTDRFDVRERLGEGGMGVVYRAYDRERDEWVALKTLSELRPGALYRFKREFRLLADVAHPNLAVLYELGSSDDGWFLTMELVDGVGFLAHVREPALSSGSESGSGVSWRPASSSAYFSRLPELEGPLPPAPEGEEPTAATEDIPEVAADPAAAMEAATRATEAPTAIADATATSPDAVFASEAPSSMGTPQAPPADVERLRPALRQLAEALHWIHQAGYIHRDVKPSNVLVTQAGRVVVLDFGLVSHIRAARYAMAVRGRTLGYIAPEVADDASKVSPASDWYAFGTMLYEALAGWRPFRHRADARVALALRMRHQPPPPGLLRPGVPEDLEQLCCDLLQIDPERRPSGEQVLQRLQATEGHAAGVRASLAAAPSGSDEIVGRDRELNQLRQAWTGVLQGKSATVLLRGTSGMGKSSIARQFLSELEGAVVLEGRCYERECVPHKALDSLVDALCGYLAQLPDDGVAELLPEDVAALTQAFPVLRRVPLIASRVYSGVESLDAPEQRRRAFAALRGLLGNIARRGPLAIFVDDLQWGDVESAPVFVGLMRAPEAPLLLLGSFRSEEVASSPLLQALLPARTQSPVGGQASVDDQSSGSVAGLVEIEVDRLSPEQSESLATELLRNGGVAQQAAAEAAVRVARESEGSPYFIQEFARFAAASRDLGSGTETLDALIRGRAEGLAEGARRLLHVVAVAGYRLAQDAARQAAGLGPEQRRAFAELRAGNFIRTAGIGREATVEPYHDRVREALVAAMPDETQRRWHQELAVSLESAAVRTGPHEAGTVQLERSEVIYALANHYYLGRPPGRAGRAFELNYRAGRMAAESFGYERAHAFLDQAQQIARAEQIELDSAFDALYGEVCGRTNRIQQAVDAFQRSLARSTAPLERAGLRLSLSRVYLGRLDAAAAHQEAAEALMEIGLPPPRPGLLDLLGALRTWRAARRIMADPQRFGCAEGAERQACRLAVHTYSQAAYTAFFGLDPITMVKGTLRLSRPAALLGPSEELGEWEIAVCIVAASRRRRKLSERAGLRAQEIAKKVDSPVARARVFLYLALSSHFLGDTIEAAERMRRALQEHGPWMVNADFLTGIADLSWNLLMRGYPMEGWVWVQRGLQRAALGAAESRLTEGHTYRCYAGPLLTMLGRPGEGAHHLDQYQQLIQGLPTDRWRWAQYLAHRALALVLDGELGEPFEEVVTAHRGLKLVIGRIPLQLRQFYVAQAYGRLWQHEQAPPSGRRKTRRRYARAMKALRSVATHETTDCHRGCIEAAFHRHEGRVERAQRILETTEAIAERTDNAWALAEIALQRARIARQRSDDETAREQALAALAFAEQRGWQKRARALRDEFGLPSAAPVGDQPADL